MTRQESPILSSTTLTLIRPDDWHLHVRDGAALPDTVAQTAKAFGRAIIMPNLVPPVVRTEQAREYHARITAASPDPHFTPLMTLYLTDNSTPALINEAAASGLIFGCKLYPAGATTNSDSGVTAIDHLYPALEAMADAGLPLLVHGEVVSPEVDIFDREKRFIDEVLHPLVERMPHLKIVLEHITTADAVAFVSSQGEQVAATLTAHHLRYNRNHMLVGGIRPHFYCLPVLKRNTHQQALLDIVVSGHPRFFLGTDSAPHAVGRKESACGCAGCYTAPIALPLYAQTFEELGILNKLEAFASFYGPDFYGLPRNTGQLTLVREPWKVPAELALGGDTIIPFLAGETLNWQIQNDPLLTVGA